MVPEAHERFLGEVLRRRPVVRPGEGEAEDVGPVRLVGALVGDFSRVADRHVGGHTYIHDGEGETHGSIGIALDRIGWAAAGSAGRDLGRPRAANAPSTMARVPASSRTCRWFESSRRDSVGQPRLGSDPLVGIFRGRPAPRAASVGRPVAGSTSQTLSHTRPGPPSTSHHLDDLQFGLLGYTRHHRPVGSAPNGRMDDRLEVTEGSRIGEDERPSAARSRDPSGRGRSLETEPLDHRISDWVRLATRPG